MIEDKEDCRALYCNILEWIKLADIKASTFFAFFGALIIFILGNAKSIELALSLLQPIELRLLIQICAWVSFFLVVTGQLFLLRVVFPDILRKEKKYLYPESAPKSDLYFGHIQSHQNSEAFIKSALGSNPQATEIMKEYLRQVYINSVIAWTKFNLYKTSSYFLISGCGLALILILIILTR